MNQEYWEDYFLKSIYKDDFKMNYEIHTDNNELILKKSKILMLVSSSIALEAFMTETSVICLDIPDDLQSAKPKNIELRIRLDQWVKGDGIDVYLDKKIIKPDQIEYTDHESKRGASVSPNVWMRFDLTKTGFTKDNHTVKIILIERTAMVTSDIIVTDVELVVRY